MEEVNELTEISIVIAGQWNAKIFNPNFVLKEIFNLDAGQEAEIGIDNGNFTLITKFKEVSLIPTDQFVEIKISNSSGIESIKFASDATLNILKIFPYTPKLALGVNFRFGPSDLLIKKYANVTMEDFEFSQITISKELSNCKQNLIIDNAYTLYNFHYKDTTLFTSSCISNNLTEAMKLWKTP